MLSQLKREANPVTTNLLPLSTFLGFIAGGSHFPPAGDSKPSSDFLFDSNDVASSPKIISKSPHSDAGTLLSSVPAKICFDAAFASGVGGGVGGSSDGGGGGALVCGESHLELMYSNFLQGGTCIPFFFKLSFAASVTIDNICCRRSASPTNMYGSD
ncbi:hypothetical protein HanPI659440_Chr03g0137651 [Helianthus annuus]|nr:hypothetical protein HanPI659440_Chr03g0137651 [Helianthus annuus]